MVFLEKKLQFCLLPLYLFTNHFAYTLSLPQSEFDLYYISPYTVVWMRMAFTGS